MDVFKFDTYGVEYLLTPTFAYDTNFYGEHTVVIQYNDLRLEKKINIEDTYAYSGLMKYYLDVFGRFYSVITGKIKEEYVIGDPTADINDYLDDGDFFVVASNPDGSSPQVMPKTILKNGSEEVPAFGPVRQPLSLNYFKVRLYHLNRVVMETTCNFPNAS